jgi:hypothetical protein
MCHIHTTCFVFGNSLAMASLRANSISVIIVCGCLPFIKRTKVCSKEENHKKDMKMGQNDYKNSFPQTCKAHVKE